MTDVERLAVFLDREQATRYDELYEETPAMSDIYEDTTQEFNMVWQNDQAVYNEIVAYTRELLRGVRGMTQQTIGRNIKDRVFAWAYGGGWGYSDGWGGATSSLRDSERYPNWGDGQGPPQGYRPSPWSYFLDREDYRYVDEHEVGEAALEALECEGYDPVTGNVA